MTICFSITTATGQIVRGQIKGKNGTVGSSYSNLSPQVQRTIALMTMRRSIEILNQKALWIGEAIQVAEKPGHCEVLLIDEDIRSSIFDPQPTRVRHVFLGGAKIDIH